MKIHELVFRAHVKSLPINKTSVFITINSGRTLRQDNQFAFVGDGDTDWRREINTPFANFFNGKTQTNIAFSKFVS